MITYNLISDHTVTYSPFRNNHIWFNLQISFNRTFAATRHVSCLLQQKCVCGQGGVYTAHGTCLVVANIVR